MKRILRYL
jgi:hypothetical protein